MAFLVFRNPDSIKGFEQELRTRDLRLNHGQYRAIQAIAISTTQTLQKLEEHRVKSKVHSSIPPVDLYLISEKSSCKNQVAKIKFDDLDFYSISNWIFIACVACKNQLPN